MTNLIASITTVIVTNWTGVTHDFQELGYIQTNHQLTVVYDGTTNRYTIKTEHGNVALWQMSQLMNISTLTITNMWVTNIIWPHYTLTNYTATNQPWKWN